MQSDWRLARHSSAGSATSWGAPDHLHDHCLDQKGRGHHRHQPHHHHLECKRHLARSVEAGAASRGSLSIQTAQDAVKFLTSSPGAAICYRASNMILKVQSDASYLSEPQTRSRAAGHFYMGNNGTDSDTNQGATIYDRHFRHMTSVPVLSGAQDVPDQPDWPSLLTVLLEYDHCCTGSLPIPLEYKFPQSPRLCVSWMPLPQVMSQRRTILPFGMGLSCRHATRAPGNWSSPTSQLAMLAKLPGHSTTTPSSQDWSRLREHSGKP